MPGPTTALFGGIEFSRGFDFTFGPGVTPSVCIINTVPHVDTLLQDGDLVLKTEGEAEIIFPDCKLEAPQLDVGINGAYWRLPILDRRWKWQFAFIYGSHNIKKPDGTYLREKTPQALAALLFDAMGEEGCDVSRLPNDPRPECNWTDGAEAAAELDKLCASLSCVVVLNYITNKAEIWPIGKGSDLPTAYPANPISGRSAAPVQNAKPRRLRADAGETRFQDTFVCEPVGLDVDGKYRHIDELTYLPPGKIWARTFPPGGFSFLHAETYEQHGVTYSTRNLAEAHVFRAYRITGLLSGGWAPLFMAFSPLNPTSLKDFRFYDELAEEEISTNDGGLRKLPARVYAKHWRENKRTATDLDLYQFGFSFDTTHGIIHFNDPVFILNPGELTQPAEVRIECSFNCGSEGVWHRLSTPLEQQEIGNANAPDTPTRVIQRPDIFLRVIQRYSNGNEAGTTEDNVSDAQKRLKYWHDAALREYELQEGGTLNYKRLMQTIPLDGRTTQITWSGGGGREPNTTVSQAQRHNRYVKPLDEYRDRLAAKQAERHIQTFLAQEIVRGAFI